MNPRYTMGRLAWELMRRVAHGRKVRFELIRSDNPAEKIHELESANPAILGRSGKLSKVPLFSTNPDPSSPF